MKHGFPTARALVAASVALRCAGARAEGLSSIGQLCGPAMDWLSYGICGAGLGISLWAIAMAARRSTEPWRAPGPTAKAPRSLATPVALAAAGTLVLYAPVFLDLNPC